MSIVQAKTLSKSEPVQSGIKIGPQGIPVWTGFTVQNVVTVGLHRPIM